MPVGPTLIKGVEKTNMVVVHPNQQTGFVPRYNLYTTEIYCKRNYYSYRDFKHVVRNCKNWEIVEQKRRIGYENNSNLNRKESLVVLN